MISLQELHKKLKTHLDEQLKNWKSFIYAQENGFYQGFEELELMVGVLQKNVLNHIILNLF